MADVDMTPIAEAMPEEGVSYKDALLHPAPHPADEQASPDAWRDDKDSTNMKANAERILNEQSHANAPSGEADIKKPEPAPAKPDAATAEPATAGGTGPAIDDKMVSDKAVDDAERPTSGGPSAHPIQVQHTYWYMFMSEHDQNFQPFACMLTIVVPSHAVQQYSTMHAHIAHSVCSVRWLWAYGFHNCSLVQASRKLIPQSNHHPPSCVVFCSCAAHIINFANCTFITWMLLFVLQQVSKDPALVPAEPAGDARLAQTMANPEDVPTPDDANSAQADKALNTDDKSGSDLPSHPVDTSLDDREHEDVADASDYQPSKEKGEAVVSPLDMAGAGLGQMADNLKEHLFKPVADTLLQGAKNVFLGGGNGDSDNKQD